MDLTQTVPLVLSLEAELIVAYPQLVRRLTFVVRDADEAQDLAQAAFERALAPRARFRGGDARAWLFTIGIRLAIDELRRRKRLVALTDDAEPEWAMRSEPDLWRALAHLLMPSMGGPLAKAVEGLRTEMRASCYDREAAIAMVRAVLDANGQGDRPIEVRGMAMLPGDDGYEAHVKSGCYVHETSQWDGQGRRTFFIAGP